MGMQQREKRRLDQKRWAQNWARAVGLLLGVGPVAFAQSTPDPGPVITIRPAP
jgi:hypothetical protein